MKQGFRILRELMVTTLLFGVTGSVSATLIGDQITGILSTPNANFDVTQPFISPATVGGGVEFSGKGKILSGNEFGIDVDVNAGGFDLSLIAITLFGFGNYPSAIRVDLQDLDWVDTPGQIVGLNTDSLPDGWIIWSSGFGPDSAFVEISKANFVPAGTKASFSFDVIHDIPEPETIALISLGLLAAGLGRRLNRLA